MMIDLHLHTYYSDGTLSPRELVKRAKSLGVTTIAVTDHDGVKGIEEAQTEGLSLNVRVIPGIEFSAAIKEGSLFSRTGGETREIYMHILGLGIDKNSSSLLAAIKGIQEKRRERNDRMLSSLRDLGYDLQQEDFRIYETQEYIGKPNFARALLKRGYTKTIQEAFEEGKFLGLPQIKGIHRAKIDGAEAIHLIHEAGGLAVLAHPMKVTYQGKKGETNFFEKLAPLLKQLIDFGLDGIEGYYSSHLDYETERLLELAEENDLLVTAGTDFHGPEMSDKIQIGQFPCKLDDVLIGRFLAALDDR